MANKLNIPAKAGRTLVPAVTQIRGIPRHRLVKLRVPGMSSQSANITHGQGYPRKT